VTLTAGGGVNYQWLRNDTAYSTDSSIVVAASGGFKLIAENQFGCFDTSAITSVVVNPLPVATISADGPTTFCQGDSVVLTAGGGINYQWLKNDTVYSSDSSIVISASGDFKLIAENQFGCFDTSAVTSVIVNPLPVAVISADGPTTFCQGDSVILTAGGGVNYQWLRNDTAIAQTPTLSVLNSGAYKLIAYSQFGCIDTSEALIITVNDLPTPFIQVVGAYNFCQGDSVRLYSSGGTHYQWFHNGNPIAGAVDSFYTGVLSGQFHVQIFNAYGCFSISPVVVATELNPSTTYRISANNLRLCTGDSALLQINASVNTRYQWKKDGVDIPGANATTLVVYQSGYYACKVTYAQQCSEEVNGVVVRVNPKPDKPTITANAPVCMGQTLTLTANAPAGARFFWSGPASFFSQQISPEIEEISLQNAGWYRLSIEVDGCVSDVDSIYVGVLPAMPAIEIQGHRSYCPGEMLKLNADSLTGLQYRWITPQGDTIAGSRLRLSLNEPTEGDRYQLLVSNGNCISYYEEIIRVKPLGLHFPTAFTPNGDGLNEYFAPVGDYFGNYSLEIFDRWGKSIFQSTQPSWGWDGQIYGQAADIGTYTYVYHYQDCSGRNAVGKGSIQLIR
jgi:gliding motility-associated-like protein